MKIKLVSCIVLFFLIMRSGSQNLESACKAETLDTMNKSYINAKQKLRATHRSNIGDSLSRATKVEIFLLRFDKVYGLCVQLESPKVFKDVSGGSGVLIIKSKELNLRDRLAFIKVLQKQLKKEDSEDRNSYNGTMHGVRIYKGNRKIFDSSFSWASKTYGMTYPDDYKRHETSEELQQLFFKLLPPSAEDRKRYDQIYKEDKN